MLANFETVTDWDMGYYSEERDDVIFSDGLQQSRGTGQ